MAATWMNVVPDAQSAVQGNDFALIPTVKIESQHSVGWQLVVSFRDL